MPRPVKSEIWFINDFYTKYIESKIRKPRIQRKKCWSKTQSYEYIKFITHHANTCLPLSVNEYAQIYDGTNLHVELFNSMCIRREEVYIEHILSSYVYA
jgi:hypothetical protein